MILEGWIDISQGSPGARSFNIQNWAWGRKVGARRRIRLILPRYLLVSRSPTPNVGTYAVVSTVQRRLMTDTNGRKDPCQCIAPSETLVPGVLVVATQMVDSAEFRHADCIHPVSHPGSDSTSLPVDMHGPNDFLRQSSP